MKNLLNPKFIFLINSLPIVILLLLLLGEFRIINSLLDSETVNQWLYYGLALSTLGILSFSYAVKLLFFKQRASKRYGFVSLIVYIGFIYSYFSDLSTLIPFSIPRWMVSENFDLYVGTFLMPTLLHSLLILVYHFTSEKKDYHYGKNFSIAIIIPITWYIFIQVVLPFWHPVSGYFSRHVMLVFFFSGTLFFLFFLIRGIYIVVSKKNQLSPRTLLVWKIVISIILPITGLLINNGHYNGFRVAGDSVFGNFSSYWFYILALLNGVLVSLPNFENKKYRILLFIGRSLTFSYTFYFFLVFLPFLPLSVIAVLAIGMGFLMLTPLLLFVIHINELSKDFYFLKNYFSITKIWSFAIVSVLVIPTIITIQNINNRDVLNQTLDYIYTPDYSKEYRLDKQSLRKTLNVIQGHKGRLRGVFNSTTPYLTSYFNWLVLDNLTLSDAKISEIQKVFFKEETFKISPSSIIRKADVQIFNFSTKSVFIDSLDCWKTDLDLEIENKTESNIAEYSTIIDLPEGCFINNYYLYVGDKKEMGLLAEKKSAMWVYSQIRNRNRDPGILHYLTGNKVAFRVFPFTKNEIRKTGIEFLHKEPLQINIDDCIIQLGSSENQITKPFESDYVSYVSRKDKELLKKVKRTPYYHFLLDVSKGREKDIAVMKNRVGQLISENNKFGKNSRVSFVNIYAKAINENWKKDLGTIKFEGGFYLDRAIKKVLYESYIKQEKFYPIIIVVTDSIENSILNKDFSDFKFTFPESDLFYVLNEGNELESHSLISNPKQRLADTTLCFKNEFVLDYTNRNNKTIYVRDNNEASLVLKQQKILLSESEVKKDNWKTAIELKGMWRTQILHPETSNRDWLSLVKFSFLSKVLTPVTAYLVVENEAQKAIIKKKQEQVLSSNQSLDLGEDVQRMSEPGLLITIIFFGIAIVFIKIRKYLLLLSSEFTGL